MPSAWRSPSGCWPTGSTVPATTVVDHRTWALVSDGDLMEGVASEAASLAGHLRPRQAQPDLRRQPHHHRRRAPTSLHRGRRRAASRPTAGTCCTSTTATTWPRIDARARPPPPRRPRPSLIVLRTIIADPAPTKRDTSGAHGAPLGADEITATKAILGVAGRAIPRPPRGARTCGRVVDARHGDGTPRGTPPMAGYAGGPSRPGRGVRAPACAATLPAGWDARIPTFTPADGSSRRVRPRTRCSTRYRAEVPTLVGGSADLAESTGTDVEARRHLHRRRPRDGTSTGASASTAWAPRSTAWPRTAACAPSAAPSWSSPTTEAVDPPRRR